ncbi:hypothetical protein Fot_40673 [Forsythia ovata]|uniref:Uncharacterized protein n=1 Tax=Forsythia ovata TaxID=205694 RepID=A0ABD1S8C0_9LAMI
MGKAERKTSGDRQIGPEVGILIFAALVVDRETGDASCDLLRVGVVPVEVVSAKIFAGDVQRTLGNGADGHDLCVVGKEDNFETTFFPQSLQETMKSVLLTPNSSLKSTTAIELNQSET